MIAIPEVLVLAYVPWCGYLRAIIVAFPGSLGGLRFFW